MFFVAFLFSFCHILFSRYILHALLYLDFAVILKSSSEHPENVADKVKCNSFLICYNYEGVDCDGCDDKSIKVYDDREYDLEEN